MNSCGRLLNSLHGSGSTILIPGFDYDSCVCSHEPVLATQDDLEQSVELS